MRHNVGHRKLGRVTEHRIALLRNQAIALLRHERIETTMPKAKELRPFVERLITIAKRGVAAGDGNGKTLHARRLVLAERRAEVRAALAALPDHYRVPLALRYDAELSYDEIATALGLKRNHVATLLHRGRREVRRRLLAPAMPP